MRPRVPECSTASFQHLVAHVDDHADDVVDNDAAQWHGAHELTYFPHYYPAFNNTYGHIFYGERGYRMGEMQRGRGESRR